MKKYLLSAILFLTSCGPAFAQWTNENSISDFSKLLQSHVSPYLVEPGAAVEARNLRANKKYGELAKRSAMDTYGTCGSFAVTGLHRYYQSDGDQYTVCSGSTLIKADANNSKTFVTIMDSLTDGARWSFVTFQNTVIATNGTDENLKWDGHTTTTANTDGARTASILMAELGAPYAELNTGSNLDASSWYQYKMQCTDGSTTWYNNALSNPILTGSSVRDIKLTDIPLCPSGTTSRTVYRTEGQASRAALVGATYKVVAAISDNSTLTYEDAIADGSLGATWSTSGKSDLTPPIGKFVNIHKESVFIANNPTYNSNIYWSYPFRKDIFNAADYEPIRENDGDEITCLMNQSGVVVICKTNSIMKLITLSADDTQWQVLGPYSTVGCQAPYSVDDTPKGIVYVSKDGIYIFDGKSSQLISDIVTKDLNDMLWTSRENIAGKYFKNEYQVAYTSVESGGSINNSVLVLDMQRDAYEIDDKEINVFAIFGSGTDEGTLYSGSSDTDGGILAHTETVGNLIYKTVTDFQAGTFDDARVTGDDNEPVIDISWDVGFDGAEFVGKGFDHVDYASAIFARPDTTGTWISPCVQINSTGLDKIYWHEDLGSSGNVTMALALGATSSACGAAAFGTEYTNPSGSDISGETANEYVRIRASLSTTDITLTPELFRSDNYVIKMVYAKEGSNAETAINTVWKSGALDFGAPDTKKRLSEIIFHYTGTSGTLNFHLTDMEGDVDKDFDINLSVEHDDDLDDFYTGTTDNKIYTYIFPNDGTLPIAESYQYEITENGATPWTIQNIRTRFVLEKKGY